MKVLVQMIYNIVPMMFMRYLYKDSLFFLYPEKTWLT